MNLPMRWRLIRHLRQVHVFLYRHGLGRCMGRIFLLLNTTGRRSGKRYVTPLQYEKIEGAYFVGSARGRQADWFRNVTACPLVEVELKGRRFKAVAEPVTEPSRIADFLAIRLQRHPRMLGAMMKLHHLPARPNRGQLEKLGAGLSVVILKPC